MPKYIVDYSKYGSSSMGPGPLPDNAYDRGLTTITASSFKTPNAVYMVATPSPPIAFRFGSATDFDNLSDSDKKAAANYENFGKPTIGTTLNIHPVAYSASKADDDAGVIRLIYKSGLSTGPV